MLVIRPEPLLSVGRQAALLRLLDRGSTCGAYETALGGIHRFAWLWDARGLCRCDYG